MKSLWKTLSIVLLALEMVSCASQKPASKVEDTYVKFSENNYLPATAARDYKRMTRQRMEEESQIQPQAGSMWVMEGQGSYLFAQNKTRREGDLLNIKVEGPAQQQIETKVSVIKKLLKQLEDEEKRARDSQTPVSPQAQSGTDIGRAPASTQAPVADAAAKEKEEPIKVETVPTRIVEKQPDGNYRIKGQQPFMIGKREYKVIVTGIIRPEDFNEEGLSSNKILDPQYDVVSLRRKDL